MVIHWQSNNFKLFLKPQLYETIISKVSIAQFLSSNILFDHRVRNIGEIHGFSDDVLCRLTYFDSVKSSIY